MADEKEIRQKLEDINRKIQIMEWDKSKNQLNPGKLPMLNGLKEEQVKLVQELESFSQPEKESLEIANEAQGDEANGSL
ncbi:hypothetical protein KY308_04075 [Candidatus Woesearchaeota archaeon]|nr:hypothetical protein [Candidatus Woesearchaeota archaeon]